MDIVDAGQDAARRAPNKYQVIYADPPWCYSDKRKHAGKNNPHGAGGAEKHYKTMKIEEIKNLQVKNICAENCYLFLWVTSPMIQEGLDVIKSWGFKYKTIAFVWVKMKKDMTKPRGDGIGNYTLSNAEYVLIGHKGKYWRNDASVRQILLKPKTRFHSQKPTEIMDRIVRMVGDVPRIELFARQRVDGWDAWGNEV